MEKGGAEFLLAGHPIQEEDEYRSVFSRFWDRYRGVDPDHAVYAEKTAEERSLTLPFAVHGDEGRGLAKSPVLVETLSAGDQLSWRIGYKLTGVPSLNRFLQTIVRSPNLLYGVCCLCLKASIYDSPALLTLAFCLLRRPRPDSGGAS